MSEEYENVEGGIAVDTEEETGGISVVELEKPKRRPYCIWKVGDEEYKLKLTSATICQLETKYHKNLLNCINDMPPLTMMLTIVQAAMQKFHHGMSYSRVQALYDAYTDDGGNQTDFFTDVIIDILTVSGFFTDNQMEDVDSKMDSLNL